MHLLAAFGLLGASTFDLVYVRGGLLLYAIKMLHDTEVLCDKARAGEQDVLTHALTSLLNFLQTFVRVIQLVADAKGREKRRGEGEKDEGEGEEGEAEDGEARRRR
jgi:hypothetical protein